MAAFGACCEDLRQAMHNKESSAFQVEEGMLFLTIGIMSMANQVGHFTKPVRSCPFCGAELQSCEKIAAWGMRPLP